MADTGLVQQASPHPCNHTGRDMLLQRCFKPPAPLPQPPPASTSPCPPANPAKPHLKAQLAARVCIILFQDAMDLLVLGRLDVNRQGLQAGRQEGGSSSWRGPLPLSARHATLARSSSPATLFSLSYTSSSPTCSSFTSMEPTHNTNQAVKRGTHGAHRCRRQRALQAGQP